VIKYFLLILTLGCTSLFYHPDRVLYVEPERFNFKYEEVVFSSSDGTELVGWFFPAKTEKIKGTIIHFHGNAQNISSHFLGLSWVMERGYNLFVWDYRGYGISDGKPSPHGVYLDSKAALVQGRKLWRERGEGKFIVYGQSLGGAVSMKALEDFAEVDQIDLVVQDCTFMSYKDLAFDKLFHSVLLPISPLSYLLISDKYSSEEFVKKIQRPTLVIVAEKDNVVPAKFGEEIYRNLSTEKKWIWRIPDGSHIMTFFDPKAPQRDQFIKLLDELP
jgi:fermentation-respiration switch protein FrsA (DUF1100 family)